MAWFTRSKNSQDQDRAPDRGAEVSEAEIAVHWQEEGIV